MCVTCYGLNGVFIQHFIRKIYKCSGYEAVNVSLVSDTDEGCLHKRGVQVETGCVGLCKMWTSGERYSPRVSATAKG